MWQGMSRKRRHLIRTEKIACCLILICFLFINGLRYKLAIVDILKKSFLVLSRLSKREASRTAVTGCKTFARGIMCISSQSETVLTTLKLYSVWASEMVAYKIITPQHCMWRDYGLYSKSFYFIYCKWNPLYSIAFWTVLCQSSYF